MGIAFDCAVQDAQALRSELEPAMPWWVRVCNVALELSAGCAEKAIESAQLRASALALVYWARVRAGMLCRTRFLMEGVPPAISGDSVTATACARGSLGLALARTLGRHSSVADFRAYLEKLKTPHLFVQDAAQRGFVAAESLLRDADLEPKPGQPPRLRALVACTRLTLGSLNASHTPCSNVDCKRPCVLLREDPEFRSKITLPWAPFRCVGRSARLYWTECASSPHEEQTAVCSSSCFRVIAADVQRAVPFDERVVDMQDPLHKEVHTDIDVVAEAVLARNAAAKHAMRQGVDRTRHLSRRQVASYRSALVHALNVDALIVCASAQIVAAGLRRQKQVAMMVGAAGWRSEMRFRHMQRRFSRLLRMKSNGQEQPLLCSRMSSPFERVVFGALGAEVTRLEYGT